MRSSLATLQTKIDQTRKQLYLVASNENIPLVSETVIEKSQELDQLINEFLKQNAAKGVQAIAEEANNMLQTSYNYDQGNQGKVTILLDGCLDISTVAVLQESLENIKDDITQIVLDFTELSFIDSTGIGALLDVIYSSRQKTQQVEFFGLNDYIKEIFETVGIIRVLDAVQRRG
jgi:anti-anti-sigma factor